MAAEPDPDRPAGRQVIEPTAIFPATPEYDDAPEGPVEGWMEELDLFRPPGTELPPEAPPMADDDTHEMTGGPSAADAWPPQEAPPAPRQPPAPAGRRRPGAALLVLAGLGAGVALSLVVMVVDRDSASGAAEGGAGATPTPPPPARAPQTPSPPPPQGP
ncbi:hypothetical protein ACFXB5_37515, partial [Streptomyces sp. NPDC059455]